MENISAWGVILSALASMVIGTIWYSKGLFGKQWMKMMGMTDKDMKKMFPLAFITLIAVSLVTAYVMAHFIIYVHRGSTNSWEVAGIKTALWAWVGLSLTTIIAHGIWDKRDKGLMLLNGVNRLITLLAMGMILGAFLK